MMRKKLRTRRTLTFLSLLFIVASIPMMVSGYSEYKGRLPDQGVNFGCQYCHESRNGGGSLNQFGIDFEENNETYDDFLGAIDSDGDGFSNSQELHSKPVTNPGDPDSFPVEGGVQTSILIFLVIVIITVIVGLVLIWRKR